MACSFLFEESEEGGLSKGLGLLPGRVVDSLERARMAKPIKCHIWAGIGLEWVNPSPITKDLEEDYAYFVHSYYVKTDNPEIFIGKASYYEEVPAVVGQGQYIWYAISSGKKQYTRRSTTNYN